MSSRTTSSEGGPETAGSGGWPEGANSLGPVNGLGPHKGPELSRLLLLGIMSLGLCLLMPLTLFAPVPLALASLIFGRKKGLGMGLGLLGLFAALAFLTQGNLGKMGQWSPVFMELMVIFGLALLFATAVSEVILRNWSPAAGLLKVSTGLALGLGLLVVGVGMPYKDKVKTTLESSMSVLTEKLKNENQELLQAPGEEARELNDFLKNPSQIFKWIPGGMAAGLVLGLWIGLFMVLRNSQAWRAFRTYPYELKDLLAFRAPDILVWPLILGLVLYVGSDYGVGPKGEVWGGNLLFAITPFYFFAGLGVYLDFLGYLKVGRAVRFIFVFGTVLMGWRYLALAGVFDIWINFRRFLKTKK